LQIESSSGEEKGNKKKKFLQKKPKGEKGEKEGAERKGKPLTPQEFIAKKRPATDGEAHTNEREHGHGHLEGLYFV